MSRGDCDHPEQFLGDDTCPVCDDMAELERRRAAGDVGRCRDCKHWGVDADGVPYAPRSGGSYYPKTLKRCHRLIGSEKVDAHEEPVAGPNIGTAPDFGCVLFEVKS